MAVTPARTFSLRLGALLIALTGPACAEPELFQSRQLTPPGEYTFGIEGPAVDTDGNLFVVNFARAGTIGRLAVGGSRSEKFAELPVGSIGNSIRFAGDGTMFVADYRRHHIFAFTKGSREPVVWFHSPAMSQPNDMTIASDGTIYASDPDWKGRRGRIWRIAKADDGSVRGQVMSAPRAMGTTNGIDLSPDGRTLYVGESGSGQIWAYTLRGPSLADARLVTTFEPDTIDGVRTDVSGRLLVARISKGAVAIIEPDGTPVQEVALTGREPTNIAFGGNDGRTVFVSQRQGGYIEAFFTDRAGREFCLLRDGC